MKPHYIHLCTFMLSAGHHWQKTLETPELLITTDEWNSFVRGQEKLVDNENWILINLATFKL
ncbi:MAG: hypothetical protein C0429_09760 [Sphingopyxis sp.]|nr:hypothetical protein [Sphingopyxis sp.]